MSLKEKLVEKGVQSKKDAARIINCYQGGVCCGVLLICCVLRDYGGIRLGGLMWVFALIGVLVIRLFLSKIYEINIKGLIRGKIIMKLIMLGLLVYLLMDVGATFIRINRFR